MAAAKSLHVLEKAGRYGIDHIPVILHVACEILKHAALRQVTVASTRMQYDGQNAEAYQVSLNSELRQKLLLLTRHNLDVDLMSGQMIASLLSAADDTTPQSCRNSRMHSRKQQP